MRRDPRDKVYGELAELFVSLRELVADLKRFTRRPKDETLLIERRVRVLQADNEGIVADVRGDSDSYKVAVYTDEGRTIRECSCEYGLHHPINSQCSHVKAVERIWTP